MACAFNGDQLTGLKASHRDTNNALSWKPSHLLKDREVLNIRKECVPAALLDQHNSNCRLNPTLTTTEECSYHPSPRKAFLRKGKLNITQRSMHPEEPCSNYCFSVMAPASMGQRTRREAQELQEPEFQEICLLWDVKGLQKQGLRRLSQDVLNWEEEGRTICGVSPPRKRTTGNWSLLEERNCHPGLEPTCWFPKQLPALQYIYKQQNQKTVWHVSTHIHACVYVLCMYLKRSYPSEKRRWGHRRGAGGSVV